MAETDNVTKLTIPEEERQALERELRIAFRQHADQSAGRRELWQTWRDLYAGILDPKEVGMDWSANINIPTVEGMVNSTEESLTPMVFGPTPIFDVSADTPDWEEGAQALEPNLQYHNERVRLMNKGSLALRDALTVGECYLIADVEQTGKSTPKRKPGAEAVDITDLDVQLITDYVTVEDMMVLPFSVPRLKNAKGMFRRISLRWNDAKKSLKQKAFYSDAVDRLELEWQREYHVSAQQESQGVDTVAPEDIWSAEFMCWEGVYRWKRESEESEKLYLVLCAYNDDLSESDVIVLKVVEYEEVYGKLWPFIPIVVNPQTGTRHGRGIPDSIGGIHMWINAAFTQAYDAVSIAILPPMAVSRAVYDMRRTLKWGPRQMWPMNNPGQDVQPVMTSPNAIAAINAIMGQTEMARNAAERTVGKSDINMGKPSEQKRTAFEMNLVAQSGNTKVNRQVAYVEFGMNEGEGIQALAYKQVELLDKFMPKVPIRYRGRRGKFAVIDPKVYSGSYTITPHGNHASASTEVRLARAQARMEHVATSPFARISPLDTPEALLLKVQHLWKAEDEFLQAMGQTNTEEVIGTEPQTLDEAVSTVAIIAPAELEIITQRGEQISRREKAAEFLRIPVEQVTDQMLVELGLAPPPGMVPIAPPGGNPGNGGGRNPQGGNNGGATTGANQSSGMGAIPGNGRGGSAGGGGVATVSEASAF